MYHRHIDRRDSESEREEKKQGIDTTVRGLNLIFSFQRIEFCLNNACLPNICVQIEFAMSLITCVNRAVSDTECIGRAQIMFLNRYDCHIVTANDSLFI